VIASTVGAAPVDVAPKEGVARARAARAKLPRAGTPTDGPDRELFEALRRWRHQQAREADVRAFVIFNDATLSAMCSRRPRDRSELLRVPGVGPVKAQRFGDEVLRIIAEHR
jgi:superfamily II DNA helicase RecQ